MTFQIQIAGTVLTLHRTWLLVVPLGIGALALAPLAAESGWRPLTRWLMAVTAVLLMGVSVVVHEAGHLAAAALRGLRLRPAVVYPFGGTVALGVAGTRRGAPAPSGAYAQVVLAGPLASLLLAGLCFAAWWRWEWVVLLWLGQFNLLLGLLNLLPAPYLDGGRLARVLAETLPQPRVVGLLTVLAAAWLAAGFTLAGGVALLSGLLLGDASALGLGLLLLLTALLLARIDEPAPLVCTPEQLALLAQTPVAALLPPARSRPRSPLTGAAGRAAPVQTLGSSPAAPLPVVRPDSTLLQALQTLERAGAATVLVVEGPRITGCLSNQQIARHLRHEAPAASSRPAAAYILTHIRQRGTRPALSL